MNHIATRTRGCRQNSVSGAVKFLSLGSHQVVTHSCATHAVRVKHVRFFPRFKVTKQLLWFDELDTNLSCVLVVFPLFELPSTKAYLGVSFLKPWVPKDHVVTAKVS